MIKTKIVQTNFDDKNIENCPICNEPVEFVIDFTHSIEGEYGPNDIVELPLRCFVHFFETVYADIDGISGCFTSPSAWTK